jgi:arginyl-tRNA synthetase
MKRFRAEIAALLQQHVAKEDFELSTPPNASMGDYAFPCFALAKKLNRNPAELALDLSLKLKPTGLISKIEAKGPFLNFFINKGALAESVIAEVRQLKGRYGSGSESGKVMVELVSPNTNKALHLGHVRNGILGESLSRILEFSGYQVFRTCINNDRGIGMCEAMMGYQLFHGKKRPKIKPDHFVAQCYVDFKNAEKKNPELKQTAQELLVDWEAEKPDVRKLWEKLVGWVYKGYKETYRKLGMKFDREYYESQIYREGRGIVMAGLKKGIFVRDEGAITAKLGDYGLPDKVLIKSDGTTLYMTQDIYLAKLKHDEFGIDTSIYVVASEQDNHFKQLFKILELLGFSFAKNCHHLSYGLVKLPFGRMKSREGTVVDADDLIGELQKMAEKGVRQRHKNLSDKEVEKRAEMIAMGALKFFMLKFDAVTSFTYNPEESLNFEGETGPYVQYAHARISSILRKHVEKLPQKPDFGLLKAPQEESLITLLGQFPESVSEAASHYRPHLVARYLMDIAQAFNEFYHAMPVLNAERGLRDARLTLIIAVQQVLKNGLGLLGIEAPEQM